MTTLKILSDIEITDDFLERVNGSVCTNGTRLQQIADRKAVLVNEYNERTLSPDKVAAFVRNFLDEGFDEKIIIT